MKNHCTCCNKTFVLNEHNVKSSLNGFERRITALCDVCAIIESILIQDAGTNLLPEVVEQYERNLFRQREETTMVEMLNRNRRALSFNCGRKQ